MNAIHSTWSKPRIYSTGDFFMEDFDILTTILSALKWREKNGRIKMVTDRAGFEFYKSRGMCGIWDEITTELDDIPDSINPEMFWAAGKIFALKNQSAPVAAIDTDFIVWDRLAFNNMGDISVIHKEDIYPDVYPDIHHFNMKQGYIFDPCLDWHEHPSNMAFYVVRNETLKNSYTDAAIEFMENSLDGDNLTYMVFAEQRLISMVAKKLNIAINAISTAEKLFKDGERYFTHTWGMKQQMRDNEALRQDFCKRCVRRILTDYPHMKDILIKIDNLKAYFEDK